MFTDHGLGWGQDISVDPGAVYLGVFFTCLLSGPRGPHPHEIPSSQMGVVEQTCDPSTGGHHRKVIVNSMLARVT